MRERLERRSLYWDWDLRLSVVPEQLRDCFFVSEAASEYSLRRLLYGDGS
jgi:hypothetical protein